MFGLIPLPMSTPIEIDKSTSNTETESSVPIETLPKKEEIDLTSNTGDITEIKPARKRIADNTDDALPPISRRQIDRMIRSGIDGAGSSQPFYGGGTGLDLEEEEFKMEGEARPPSRKQPSQSPEDSMEERAMFEEVITEIMTSGDMTDIYDVHFTPIDPTVIPFISTVVFLYFWLRQGADDEMPQMYDQQKIDGYFSSQPFEAIQRSLEITAAMIELGLVRQVSKLGLLDLSEDESANDKSRNVMDAAASLAGAAVREFMSTESSTDTEMEDSSVLPPLPLPQTPEAITTQGLVSAFALEEIVGQTAVLPEKPVKQSDYDTAVRLREVLQGLGPTFIKLGQALANRPDVIGKLAATELTELQDRLPPFPYEEVCRIMEEELGSPPHLLFDEFSATPVNAGSLGQVHKARIGNEWLAVKVQRPRLLDDIGKDLYILRQAVQLLPAPVDLVSVVDTYGQALMEEIDYKREVENMIRFRKLYGRIPNILIPRVFTDYCSNSIITMEWVDGVRIVQRSLSVSKEDLPLLETGIRCTFKQLLEIGFLHADPHGGNLYKTNCDPPRLAYLDFGIVTQVPLKIRDSILRAVLFLVNGDFEKLAQTFPGLLLIDENDVKDRIPQFARELRKRFGPLLDKARAEGELVPKLPFGALLKQMLDIAQNFKFTIPPYFLSNVRALAELEGLAMTADPNYNLLSSVYPFAVQRMLVTSDDSLRGALEQLIFDPEEGLRTEVLQSILSVSDEAHTRSPSTSDTKIDIIRVTPTREQFAFVQRVLVKLLLARGWAYVSIWIDDIQSKFPKILRSGLPARKPSLDPLDGDATYSTTRLFKQISLVQPVDFFSKFWQMVMLSRVLLIVSMRLTFRFCLRTWSDLKGIIEHLVSLGVNGVWKQLKTLWSYWRA